jgi:Ran GTPase-activating protein (RanGAP) involved in mRNA processing and transport
VSLDLGTDTSALYPNRFNNLVGVAFGQSLSQNSTLTRLGLSGVGIGRLPGKGIDAQNLTASSFGHMLRANNTLEVLSISNNQLGTGGCVILWEGLMHNRSLKVLDMSKNGAGPEVGVVMGQVIGGKHSGIEVLDFSSNPIGPNGISSMVSSLIGNNRLRSLDISHTDMQVISP